MKFRGAILDDYSNVARQAAEWSQLPEIDFHVFTQPLAGIQKVIEALKGAAVVCVMRERTPISRAVIEALPDLKMIATGGTRNAAIDIAAAKERGIVVCGTASIGYTPGELTI